MEQAHRTYSGIKGTFMSTNPPSNPTQVSFDDLLLVIGQQQVQLLLLQKQIAELQKAAQAKATQSEGKPQ
jgi:hypothetical protein